MAYKMIAVLARFFIEVILSTKIEMNTCIKLYFKQFLLTPKKLSLEKKLKKDIREVILKNIFFVCEMGQNKALNEGFISNTAFVNNFLLLHSQSENFGQPQLLCTSIIQVPISWIIAEQHHVLPILLLVLLLFKKTFLLQMLQVCRNTCIWLCK